MSAGGDLSDILRRLEILEQASRAEIGTIQIFAGDVVPQGWLLCDGAAHPSAAPLDVLAGVLGGRWGTSAAGTFLVPDLRGRFVRGVDRGTGRDLDASSRGPSAPGSATGDAVGSSQEPATARPQTPFTTDDPGDHVHKDPTWNGQQGPYELATTSRGPGGHDYGAQAAPTTGAGNHSHKIVAGGDRETRPTNVAVNFIIKAF